VSFVEVTEIVLREIDRKTLAMQLAIERRFSSIGVEDAVG
tara:strand:+ start:171 stop:290 length:120 start_codon:yes stop_codon:yes gene_type:complete